ncbi:Retrovirus-related Pol polyprotein from transposon RE1 [Vitis vinifera]|uniref:Retrovirus-related Pol polyprotein from transposon RE1 n=1 Tax=Vitis vinifera TaxID=29760 RepID=A0A438H7J5_VITVI|nr:Retrovirus-related Pol polyprotein from transposon RE1 [Vitis vinifera]
MSGCQPVDTPIEEGLKLCVEPNQVSTDKGRYQRLVGRLMYLAHTRPDLSYALSVIIELYTDADWAGAVDDRRPTFGYFTFVGGNLVTWKSKKQNVVAHSSAEAEFRGHLSRQPIRLFCDNKVACDIAHNPVQHDRTKHVEVNKFFIKEKLDDKIVELPKIRLKDQLTNILIKAAILSRVFSKFLDKLGMCDIYAPT